MNRRHYNHYELQDGLFGASVAIGVLFMVSISTFLIMTEAFTGHEIFNRKGDGIYYGIIAFVILSYLLLHYTLLSKDKWRKYEAEFKAYPRKKNRGINRIIILLVILLFILLVLSFVIMKIKYDAGLMQDY